MISFIRLQPKCRSVPRRRSERSLKQRKCMRLVDEIRDWFNRWGEILAWAWRFDGADEERDLDG